MPTVGLFNKEGNKIEDIQLNETIFAAEVNADAMHQVVVALLANKRQGTQSAKTRAEVRGGGITLVQSYVISYYCCLTNNNSMTMVNK